MKIYKHGAGMHTAKEIGSAGEVRACAYLQGLGYSPVAKNWRTRFGEIDIIVETGNTLVFVEVKTLPGGDAQMLAQELNERKRLRIIETSKRFLLKHREYSNKYIRYDVIVVDLPGYPAIYHMENVFSE